MKKETKGFLEKKKLIIGLPAEIKIRRKDGSLAKFPARKGSYVVEWKNVLKAFRIEQLESKT